MKKVISYKFLRMFQYIRQRNLVNLYNYLLQRERKLMVGGREVSLAQQYAAIGLCSVPIFLLAGAGKNYFNKLEKSY